MKRRVSLSQSVNHFVSRHIDQSVVTNNQTNRDIMSVNRREKSKTLWGPQMLSCEEDSLGVGEIQVSAHLVVSKSLIEDIAHVFPDRTIDHPVVITTMQHAKMELVQLGQEVDAEKDFLLERVRIEYSHSLPLLAVFVWVHVSACVSVLHIHVVEM